MTNIIISLGLIQPQIVVAPFLGSLWGTMLTYVLLYVFNFCKLAKILFHPPLSPDLAIVNDTTVVTQVCNFRFITEP